MEEQAAIEIKPHFGVYELTPKNSPFYTPKTEEPYWKLDGWRIWGERVRLRFSVWEAGNTVLREYQDGDDTWQKTHKVPLAATVIVTKSLDEARVAEAIRAVALLPLDPDTGLPDHSAKLDECVKFGLKCGWDPRLGATKIKILSTAYIKRITARHALPWNDENSLSKSSFDTDIRAQKHTVSVFGDEPLAEVNSKERQRAIIEGLPEGTPKSIKEQALFGLGRILRDLVNLEKLGIARIYSLGRTISLAIPEVMTIPQQQEYLDEFWFTELAAASVAKLHLGIRPWSDLGESKAIDVKYGLSPDYRQFLVKPDSKTGWRAIVVPPVGRKLFARLDKEGRLSKKKNTFGYHILHEGDPTSWTHHYAKLGYTSTPSINRPAVVSEDALLKEFRERYPVKYGEYVPDFTRKTHITAYLVTSDGQKDRCATYHGNSDEIIDEHYAGLMSRAAGLLSCRLIPTALKGETQPEEIALPHWSTITLDKEEQAEYAKLVEALPEFTHEMAEIKYENIRSERAKATWAARKARPDYKQSPAFQNLEKLMAANPRHKHYEELLRKRIEVLVKYATDFPEGFRYKDIRGILETAGLDFPPSEKWIKKIVAPHGPFTVVNRFYVLQESAPAQ